MEGKKKNTLGHCLKRSTKREMRMARIFTKLNNTCYKLNFLSLSICWREGNKRGQGAQVWLELRACRDTDLKHAAPGASWRTRGGVPLTARPARGAARGRRRRHSTDVQRSPFNVGKCQAWKLSSLFTIFSNMNLKSVFMP